MFKKDKGKSLNNNINNLNTAIPNSLIKNQGHQGMNNNISTQSISLLPDGTVLSKQSTKWYKSKNFILASLFSVLSAGIIALGSFFVIKSADNSIDETTLITSDDLNSILSSSYADDRLSNVENFNKDDNQLAFRQTYENTILDILNSSLRSNQRLTSNDLLLNWVDIVWGYSGSYSLTVAGTQNQRVQGATSTNVNVDKSTKLYLNTLDLSKSFLSPYVTNEHKEIENSENEHLLTALRDNLETEQANKLTEDDYIITYSNSNYQNPDHNSLDLSRSYYDNTMTIQATNQSSILQGAKTFTISPKEYNLSDPTMFYEDPSVNTIPSGDRMSGHMMTDWTTDHNKEKNRPEDDNVPHNFNTIYLRGSNYVGADIPGQKRHTALNSLAIEKTIEQDLGEKLQMLSNGQSGYNDGDGNFITDAPLNLDLPETNGEVDTYKLLDVADAIPSALSGPASWGLGKSEVYNQHYWNGCWWDILPIAATKDNGIVTGTMYLHIRFWGEATYDNMWMTIQGRWKDGKDEFQLDMNSPDGWSQEYKDSPEWKDEIYK